MPLDFFHLLVVQLETAANHGHTNYISSIKRALLPSCPSSQPHPLLLGRSFLPLSWLWCSKPHLHFPMEPRFLKPPPYPPLVKSFSFVSLTSVSYVKKQLVIPHCISLAGVWKPRIFFFFHLLFLSLMQSMFSPLQTSFHPFVCFNRILTFCKLYF